MKKILIMCLISLISCFVISCAKEPTNTIITTDLPATTSIETSSSIISDKPTRLEWDGEQVIYDVSQIRSFGSATPSGVANYNEEDNTVSVWNTDASLDNYGGIQTPSLLLDFSKSVIFEMKVESVFSEYIIKLAVEGESEYYYVISDESRTGTISVNVVDAMLSDKYRAKNTQPDPGYQDGWIYDGQIKNCSFHILAKGPDGERQTAELVISQIAIYNNQTAISHISIGSNAIHNNQIDLLKGSDSIDLTYTLLPSSVENKQVFWETDDETIASVDSQGRLTPVGVGQTFVTVTSIVDQSKQDRVLINVLSGYEDLSILKSELNNLEYGGSDNDYELFDDMFKTSFGTNEVQEVVLPELNALDYRLDGHKLFIENYFDANNTIHVSEASASLIGNDAKLSIQLNHNGVAQVYEMIDNRLYKYDNTSAIDFVYARYTDGWKTEDNHLIKYIIVWDNGDVKKIELNLMKTTLLGDYSPSNLANSDLWLVPDRTKQDEDSVINALSPALVNIKNDSVEIKQNKYPESKYSFGGIVSELFMVDPETSLQIIIDVDDLNQMNDFVKTMWEIKVIYYQSDGVTAVNTNPLRVASSNQAGTHVIDFKPTYQYFRIYLVVNGSDIGAQFADATMILGGLKIYQID